MSTVEVNIEPPSDDHNEEEDDTENNESILKMEEKEEEEDGDDVNDIKAEDDKGDERGDDDKDDGEPKQVDEDPAPEPPAMELRIEIRHDDDDEEEKTTPEIVTEEPSPRTKRRQQLEEEEKTLLNLGKETEITDPKVLEDMEYIKNTPPTSRLEIALAEALERKELHVRRLTNEITKLKSFISKRKQTYKRKRKDEGAPTRALSAYNIFIKDRFAELAKENEAALKSADSEAQLKRVPPASLVSVTGNEWKKLPAEEKAKYEERAKTDRKRYDEQMAKYQPPDKQANRKRNKTGYNMFFSAHVLRLKQSEMGVPSERGSVARLVGTAWKALSADEKQYYEKKADDHNDVNPVEKEEEEVDDDEMKQQQAAEQYGHIQHPHDYGGMPPPMHPGMHQPQHDPRHHGYPGYPPHHMYAQPPPHGYYDYGGGHHSQSRHQHSSRSQGQYQGYPPSQGHPYDQRMNM